MYTRRGISELVAAVILLAVVIAAGGMLLATAYRHFAAASNALVRESLYVKRSARSRAAVVAAKLLANGTLHIVVSTGRFPVQLLAVYVNSTLCLNSTAVIPPLTAVLLVVEPQRCPPLALNPASIPVKVVYDGGEELLYASR